MISCTNCNATPVFVYAYYPESDTFQFLCGYCIGELLSSTHKDEITKFSSMKSLDEKLNQLIMKSQNQYNILEKSKIALEKNSKNEEVPKIVREKKELQNLANIYYELANSLQEQSITLKSRILSSDENSRQLCLSALISLSSLESKLVKIKELKSNNSSSCIEEQVRLYEQLKINSHSTLINQALKESKANETTINLKLAFTQLKEQVESLSNCIKCIERFFYQHLGDKHNELIHEIAHCPSKSEVEVISIDHNDLKLQPKAIELENIDKSQTLPTNYDLKSEFVYKYVIYFNMSYNLKCYNTQLERFYDPRDIKSSFMQINSFLCNDFRYVNTGNGILICGGGVQKGETIKDCYLLEVNESANDLNLKLEVYPQMLFSRKRHNIIHIKSKNRLGKPIGIIFSLSGLKTNKCEFTVLEAEGNKNERGWKQLPPLNRVRSNASTFVANNIAYIYGGFDNDFEGKYHNSFESFPVQDSFKSINETKWTLIEFKTQNVNKSAFSSIVLNEDLTQIVYIVGGFNGSNCDHYFKAEVYHNKEWKITEEKPFPNKCLFLNQDFKLGSDLKLYAFDFLGTLYSYDSAINIIPD